MHTYNYSVSNSFESGKVISSIVTFAFKWLEDRMKISELHDEALSNSQLICHDKP